MYVSGLPFSGTRLLHFDRKNECRTGPVCCCPTPDLTTRPLKSKNGMGLLSSKNLTRAAPGIPSLITVRASAPSDRCVGVRIQSRCFAHEKRWRDSPRTDCGARSTRLESRDQEEQPSTLVPVFRCFAREYTQLAAVCQRAGLGIAWLGEKKKPKAPSSRLFTTRRVSQRRVSAERLFAAPDY